MTQSSLLSKDSIRPVFLALLITSYHHDTAVQRTLEMVRSSRFFEEGAAEYGHLFIIIIDNGKTLDARDEWHLSVLPNRNTGGSGGFRRGLEEARKRVPDFPTTHVIFADDDAEFEIEALYRTYEVLTHLKDEYRDSVIAGRMYDARRRDIQYTACEIWNRGELQHVEFNVPDADIRADEISAAEGEYTGWWYAVYPWSFVKDNDPLPFFLHCDDVEYGLRQGKEPVILNGIQVWHESPLRRGTSTAAYYDIRNSMIVNSLGYDGEKTVRAASDILKKWRKKLDLYRDNHDIDSENMALLAMEHFLKGPGWVYNADGGRLHRELLDKRSVEAINKRVLRLAVKLPYGKINEFKRARTESTAIKELKKAVKEYRLWSKEKRVADYADENI